LSKRETSETRFIHYCINCGKQLSQEQTILRCSNCGSTTFKLKIQKETKETHNDENKIKHNKSFYTQKTAQLVAENNLNEDTFFENSLETIRAKGIGIFEIDISGLAEGKPLILSVNEGQYEISLQKLMRMVKKR
jgi:predicted  nucleic acid-binding Zn-ribbon protein